MIVVFQRDRAFAGSSIEFDRSGVLATQIVEVGDVVVRLGDQKVQPVLGAMLTGALVCCESFREFVQADVTDGQVVERHGDVAGFSQCLRLFEGALVERQGFLEPVLPEIKVRQVGVEPCQPHLVSGLAEQNARLIGPPNHLVVQTNQDERLKRAAQRPAELDVVTDAAERVGRGVVACQRFPVATSRIEHVAFASIGPCPPSLRVSMHRHRVSYPRYAFRSIDVDTQKVRHAVTHAIEQVIGQQARLSRERAFEVARRIRD